MPKSGGAGGQANYGDAKILKAPVPENPPQAVADCTVGPSCYDVDVD